MRVELGPLATANAQKMSQALNRSVNEIANIVMEQMTELEIKQVITMKLKRDPEIEVKPRIHVIRRVSTWKATL